MCKTVKLFNDQISFKQSKDEIKLHTFVSDGTDIGFVSFANIDNTFVVNWYGKNISSTEDTDSLHSVRPRFQTSKLHGEIWKGAYLNLNYVLSTGSELVIKPKYYRKSVEEDDVIEIVDYKLLYKYRDLMIQNVFEIISIDKNTIHIYNFNNRQASLQVKRNQIRLKDKPDTFMLLDIICPVCKK